MLKYSCCRNRNIFTMNTFLKQLNCGLSSLVYPDNCILCKTPNTKNSSFVCCRCQNTIILNIPPFCAKCSRHLKDPSESSLCLQCQKTLPNFDFAWAPTRYTDNMRHLIHLFKYKNKTALRHLFFNLLVSFIKDYNININQFDFIMPVPLHPTRLRERQYNQTQLLAKMLSKKFHIPMLENTLFRHKHTKAQALLNEKERWTNVKDAFRIRHSSNLFNKSILIVDDLITTSATACEIAQTIKKAQVKQIGILALSIT